MRFRNLRIAFSITCGLACVLLILLWVRSYRCWDNLTFGAGHSIDSLRGRLLIDDEIGFPQPGWDASSSEPIFGSSLVWTTFSIRDATAQGLGTAIPTWLPVTISGVFAVAPWIRYSNRFSLRTLLILTTLVATILGLIAWLR